MKRKISLAIGGVVAAGVLAFGIFYSSGSQGTTILSADEISEKVTSEYPGEITEIERESDLNHAIYEVELSNEGKLYGLKIDGSTAEILEIKEKSTSKSDVVPEESEAKDNSDELSIEEKETDEESSEGRQDDGDRKSDEKYIKNKHHHKHKEKHSKKGKHSSMHTVISVEEAKKIALKAFPGEIDDIDLEKEDGRLVYEIEIERDDQEAEILIDAYTGEIIIIEIDED